MLKVLAATFLLIAFVNAFGGDDRFIKKYAMMKIYESCFGQEVVKQIRKEMRDAVGKCAVLADSPSPPRIPPIPVHHQPHPLPVHPSIPSHNRPNKIEEGLLDPQNALFANAQTYDDKANQAFLAYRPNPFQIPAFRPYGGNGGYYPGFASMGPLYYPAGLQQSASPYAAQPYAVPFLAQPYYNGGGSHRMSKDLDIRGQLEVLTAKLTSKAKNVTCVMQELGYLNDNLEPNFEKIRERISLLPVPDELRTDMQDGVNFCQQFSQCVPDVNKDKSPLSRELIRPMFFFKCYKHKKLEACIMKDVREKFAGVDEDFEGTDVEFRRGRGMKTEENDLDGLAASMYDFLYGSDSNMDLDSFF